MRNFDHRKVFNYHTKKFMTRIEAVYALEHGLACAEDFLPQHNGYDKQRPLETAYDDPYYYVQSDNINKDI